MKTTLLIMAAGLGSRYGGDKQIDGIGPHGELLMQYSIYDALRAGFDKLVFVIKPQYRELIDGLCASFPNAEKEYVYQDFSELPDFYKIPSERTKPFGTVHAVLCAERAVREPFAVINADDFYGADAFAKIHEKLLTLKESEAAMVSYKLKNTVSRNGAVTRGVCRVENGLLAGVRETYKITVDENGKICDGDCGELDGNVSVSMNLWGFSADVFKDLNKSFSEFLRSLPEGEIKAEYALPSFVDKQIKQGELSVGVLTTDAVWFGVTYRADREYVAAELKKLHESGAYPEKLGL